MVDSRARSDADVAQGEGRARKEAGQDASFKVLMIGDSSVGKTATLGRFTEDNFPHSFISTVGIDYKQRSLEINGKQLRLSIWDTAGQERFRTLTNAYYRGAHGVVVMYDITNRPTFLNVPEWIDNTREYGSANTQIVLVGNKKDREDREVSPEEGHKLARMHRVKFYETSALTGENCDAVFETLAKEMLNTACGGGYDAFMGNHHYRVLTADQDTAKGSGDRSCSC